MRNQNRYQQYTREHLHEPSNKVANTATAESVQTSATGNDQQEVYENNKRMASISTIGNSQTGNPTVGNEGTSQAATRMPEELHSPPPTQNTTRTSMEKQGVNTEREHDMATSGRNQGDGAQTATFLVNASLSASPS